VQHDDDAYLQPDGLRNRQASIGDISALGAGREVANSFGIPHEISLRIPSQYVNERCYLVWRNDKRMGVSFA
jgi:hypothetical protein